MAMTQYETVLREAQRLAPSEQRRLIEALEVTAKDQASTEEGHSLLELRGLGKHLWEQVNTTEYLNTERAAWDG